MFSELEKTEIKEILTEELVNILHPEAGSIWSDISAISRVQAREVAREEIGSAMGLLLNRLGKLGQAPTPAQMRQELLSSIGELLRDFGTPDEPGRPAPGA